MAVLSNQVGKQLLEALGIELEGVLGVTLVFEAHEPVEARVRYVPSKAAVEGAVELLKSYEMHEKPD